MTDQEKLNCLFFAMCEHDMGNAHRIQHFTKVHGYMRLIALEEGLNAHDQLLAETAGLTHDIGIRPALELYGTSAGPYQEKAGVAPAREMLGKLGYSEEDIAAVCDLIATHHTYMDNDSMLHRILIEADLLVNLHEHGDSADAVRAAEAHFRTESGKKLLRCMFSEK